MKMKAGSGCARLGMVLMAGCLWMGGQSTEAASLPARVAGEAILPDLASASPEERARALAANGFREQSAGRHQAAMEAFYAALNIAALTPSEERTVRLAWADSALASHQPAVVKDALAPYVGQRDQQVQARLQSALEQLRYKHLDTAYRHLREGDDARAVKSFRAGFAEAAGTTAHYADAAYAAKRIGDNGQSAGWFRAALEAQGQEALTDAIRFGYRREVEQLERSVGVVASLDYQGGGLSPSATREVGQLGAEVYWQPEDVGYREGRVFQVYGRAYETVYDAVGEQTGADTVQAALGARYKPLSGHSLVLAVERLLAAGELARTDWLLRAAYSLGEGGDWNPAASHWPYWSFYAEAARYVDARQSVQTLEGRFGHSWALSADGVAVTPHLVLAADHDTLEADSVAAGVGPGVSVRAWFGGDLHRAPPSWCDLTLQYRSALTDADRAHGAVVRATLWY